MALGGGAKWLFLLCLPSVINAETNQAKRHPRDLENYVQYHQSNTSSTHAGRGHSYPGSHGRSGTGKQVTRAPHATLHTWIQHTRAPYVVHKYPPSGSINRTTPVPHSYPPSGGGSGSGPKPLHQQGTPATHSYPPSYGGSAGGHKIPPQQVTPGTHSYPPSYGGYQLQHPKQPAPTQGYVTGVYPHPTRHTGYTGYNNEHVNVRNQQTNIGITNYNTTNVDNYEYSPPMVISYSGPGAHYSYPVYTGNLPIYVYEYRESRSRYRYLLTGLALYNFGLLYHNSESKRFHNSYTPNVNDICKFGVRQYEGTYEEVDIDCRLITNFMWSERHQPITPYEMTSVDHQVFNALDPNFYGEPLQIKQGMQCYIKWKEDEFLNMRLKDIECGLLQTYVDRSFNSATKVTTTFLVVVTSFVVILLL